MLVGEDCGVPLKITRAVYEEAERRLHNMAFVGLTDAFNASVSTDFSRRCSQRAGLTSYRGCRCWQSCVEVVRHMLRVRVRASKRVGGRACVYAHAICCSRFPNPASRRCLLGMSCLFIDALLSHTHFAGLPLLSHVRWDSWPVHVHHALALRGQAFKRPEPPAAVRCW